MPDTLFRLLFAFAWVGHACICTAALNHLYGRPLPKTILKPFRLLVGVAILAFPLLLVVAPDTSGDPLALGYALVCLVFGAVVFPAITLRRLVRTRPAAVLSQRTHTLNLGRELGPLAVGDHKWAWMTRLPFNDVFRVEFTDLELAIPDLPGAWAGLTVLLVSDLHLHGTPSRAFFERVFAEIESHWPMPDVVCLGGDYVDSDAHREWLGPLLGRLNATEAKFAVLGNHDLDHDPAQLRLALASAGYNVLGNHWREVVIRGERGVVVGHEGPWFRPPPDLSKAPTGFRLCLSHTPDNVYWGVANGIRLMVCGHVHGGQVRIPLIGPIFVPSVYGRRFDGGVYAVDGTVLVAGRGLGGKEPLRFRCPPQVLRLTLRVG